MTTQQKNTALVGAIITGLVSLPMTWMTIQSAQIQFHGGPANMFPSVFNGMAFQVTGLNGSVTLLFKIPLWFLVGVGMAASVLQFMRSSQTFAIPKFAEWGTAIFAVVWMTVPVVPALFSGKVSPGLGWLLGMVCAVTPLVCLFRPASRSNEGTKPEAPKSDEPSEDDDVPFLSGR